MGDGHIGVRVEDVQEAVQFIREQNIVVRTKGTVGRFNRGKAELDLLVYWDRRVIDLMRDVQSAPTNRLPVLG